MSAEQAATVTPGQAAYLATVTQAIIDGHGIGEYPAYGHLQPWQRERWEAAAQAAIEAAPPAIIHIDRELSETDVAELREKFAEAVRTERPRVLADASERVAELVTEGNELRRQLRGLLAILTEGDEDDETVRERATAQVRMMLADDAPVAFAGTEHLVPVIRDLAIGAEDQP